MMSIVPQRLPGTPPRTRDHSPQKKDSASVSSSAFHASTTLANWQKLQSSQDGATVCLDGSSLDIADVLAVSKYGAAADLTMDGAVRQKIESSIKVLHSHLQSGHLVYGVTTGFGGSADTRTTDFMSLQRALVQHQSSGVLTAKDIGQPLQKSGDAQSSICDYDSEFAVHSMPTSWVRASMLTRCNSIIRGHSAVRVEVAEAIMACLRHEITPIIPLRGSVSASGDLSPLSYVASTIEGNPGIFVRCGKGTKKIVRADVALKGAGIQPIVLQAKEGLGLLNGTAFSAATASLAIYQSQEAAVLAQILTAMGVEAMTGSAESFYPQIAAMRPHPGQIESARNILSFLDNSKLAQSSHMPMNPSMPGLCQDRYAWRTASQWIGPQLEDLLHAQSQLKIELNSTTDNPLIDNESGQILHGGNFQAAVVTSAMDRARLALEKLGRMLFAQATEVINPAMNRGLPPNLASDDPSLSYTCKGVDINIAAYASELGVLANPVGNHVMSAEMHNQAINSMALVSSRYTLQALDVLRMMSASYLFMVCQALDMRVLQIEFLKVVKEKVQPLISKFFPTEQSAPVGDHDRLRSLVYQTIEATWSETSTLDLVERSNKVADEVMSALMRHIMEGITTAVISINVNDQTSSSSSTLAQTISFPILKTFILALQTLLEDTYSQTRAYMYANHLGTTPKYLGKASSKMYTFIRKDLNLSFHRGLVEHPLHEVAGEDDGSSASGATGTSGWGMSEEYKANRSLLGTQVSVIYEALGNGRMGVVMREIVEESLSSTTINS